MKSTVTPLSIAKCPPTNNFDYPSYNWETQSLDYQGEGEFRAAQVVKIGTGWSVTGTKNDPDYDAETDK